MTIDDICECGHEISDHQGGDQYCRVGTCDCTEYAHDNTDWDAE